MFLTVFNTFNNMKRQNSIKIDYLFEIFEIFLFRFSGTAFAECLGKIVWDYLVAI